MANESYTVSQLSSENPPEGAIWVDSLDLTRCIQSWGWAHAKENVTAGPISIAGQKFKRGIGTHAFSDLHIDLKGAATRFVSWVGVDDSVEAPGTVVFEVWVDGDLRARSPVIRHGGPAHYLDLGLDGARHLLLVVTDAGDGIGHDHADWAGAALFVRQDAAEMPAASDPIGETEPAVATGWPDEPQIHGARTVGATPGYDFHYLIPATGRQPLTYSADNLPDGLALDAQTGIITGKAPAEGQYAITLKAANALGSDSRVLILITGRHKLALTPPMGWNSWNVWAAAVDADKVKAAADALVRTGLARFGYQYVNIDDCWEAGRDENGEILSNDRFPDMKGLADYIHGLGLKVGIYSSPGPRTCGGFTGSYQHEHQDAKTWASWGMDYLKYDWCSYGEIVKDPSLEDLKSPYRLMREALDACGRDIVFSLCQYGMGEVWKWGAEVGGNCWRTTGDIHDSWYSMEGIGFSQDGKERYAGPGHWNDPDMMVLGYVGWGPTLRKTRLTPNEQLTHMTLWVLVCSPILLGCDLERLDEFTLALLTNHEVIDVHQDPLGKAAGKKAGDDYWQVWSRPLYDGTTAVGVFNRGRKAENLTVSWKDIGLEGEHPVRDLWARKDLGVHSSGIAVEVPGHGAALLKVGKPTTG